MLAIDLDDLREVSALLWPAVGALVCVLHVLLRSSRLQPTAVQEQQTAYVDG
jgi:hypothetical protein